MNYEKERTTWLEKYQQVTLREPGVKSRDAENKQHQVCMWPRSLLVKEKDP